VPGLLRLVLRLLLSREAAERALADLADGFHRERATRGSRSAGRWCVREALGIVVWAALDRVGFVRIGTRRTKEGESARRGGAMNGMVEDVRFGVRSLLRRPRFAALAAGVLAVGIGANATMFTLANRLFLAAPPGVSSPENLIRVFRSWSPGEGGSMSYPNYLDLREAARTVMGLAAYNPSGVAVTARFGGEPTGARVWLVTDNYFDVLGARAVLGRFFRVEENATPGTHPVVVVSNGFWRRSLGGSRDAIGRDIVLNGHPFTIVGVTAAEFQGLGPVETPPDFYVPIMMRNAITPTNDTAWRERIADFRENWLTVVGRKAPGANFEAVRAELVSLGDRIAAQYPELNAGETVWVTPQFRYHPSTSRTLSGITRILLIVVAVVLAIAAANAAILLLSRTSGRARELGIRSAIGAGRSRVVRLLLTESLILAGAGGATGVLLSVWGARAAGALLPVPIPDATPDQRVLVWSIVLTLITALAVGLAPAFRAARSDVVDLIQDRGRTGRSSRMQSGLVVLQVALSLVLVTGAAVFVRSLTTVRGQEIGFDPGNTLVVEMNLRNHGYDVARGQIFHGEALERIASLPGVERVATTRMVPFQGDWTTSLRSTPSLPLAGGREELEVGMDIVSPGYFATIGTPILKGRGFDSRDRNGAPATVINEALAEALWPGEDPLGRSIPLRGAENPPFTVVGIVQNATYYRVGEEAFPHAWGSTDQVFQLGFAFLVRTAGDPLAMAPPVREVIHALDPDIALSSVMSLQAAFDGEIARYRVTAQLVGWFGALALVLASAGLYGVLAFFVQRRTREIGVCMALGATRQRIANGVLRRGLGLTAIGIVVGMIGAFALADLVRAQLFQVSPTDPLSFAIAPIVLLSVAVLAVLVPVRRAMAIDPMRAIRAE
jgi:predicted permease